MRNVFFIGLVLFTSSLINFSYAQKSKDAIVLTVADENVKLSEFEAIYRKNNSDESIDPKSVEEYLELYINFKLKVKEAKDMGLDTFPKFKKELKGYREQLARPYLSDKEVTEALIDEAYERMKSEIRASHILVSVSLQASPEDTLAAYKKTMELRKSIVDGEPFEDVATQSSNDPSAKENKGDLGYFSALYMVYPFETAAYNTQVGEVSMPVRTRFGYHLIKVVDKRPYQGEIKVAHIMTRFARGASAQEIEEAKKKIDEIYTKVKDGEDFADLAMKFSDDKNSAKDGGELPPFKAGRMIIEFEDVAFALKEDGQLSEPVKTDFGWHIIKRLEKWELPAKKDIYVDLKDKISKDSRSHKSKDAMLAKIKANYSFKDKIEERNDFYTVIDTSYFNGNWDISKAKGLDKPMFKLGKKEYTQQDFAKFLAERQRPGVINKDPKYTANTMYEEFVIKSCFDYEDSKLEEKYPEFKMLMQEYHDGILLFDLTDQKVWSKAVKDTTGLEAYYEKNKESYKWGERLHAVIYSCASDDIAKNVKSLIAKKNKGEMTLEELKGQVNEESKLNLTVEKGKFSKGDHELIDKTKWEKGLSSVTKKSDRFIMIEVIEKLSPSYKELTEIRGLVTSDYQNYLEQEWIKSLRGKYKVTVNKEVLKELK